MPDQEQSGREAAAPAPTEHGALRVSHEDRDQVAEALRVAAGDGRLTAGELDERLEKALNARTYDDLAPLLADLPAAGSALAQLPGPLAAVMASGVMVGGAAPAAAKELVKIHVTSGVSKRDGRWVVPARMNLKSRSGHIELDFTDAIISQPTLHIDAEVRSGTIILVTRPGIAVDLDDVSVRGGVVRVDAPWSDSVPAFLRITVAGTCRSGTIIARPPRPPRRSFWQWLRRAPRRQAITA
ncbi:MAG: DUF1707 SHOCT-like domain-containing protein [Trebonia sp.]